MNRIRASDSPDPDGCPGGMRQSRRMPLSQPLAPPRGAAHGLLDQTEVSMIEPAGTVAIPASAVNELVAPADEALVLACIDASPP